jgi:hypothetical protein
VRSLEVTTNLWTKTLAATAVSGLLVFSGAGVAHAHSGDDTRVDDNRIEDTANVDLDDVLNGDLDEVLNDIVDGNLDVGDVASGNYVLDGNDVDVLNGILNGNLSGNDVDADTDADTDADADADADVDADGDASAEQSEDDSEGHHEDDEGLLGDLL